MVNLSKTSFGDWDILAKTTDMIIAEVSDDLGLMLSMGVTIIEVPIPEGIPRRPEIIVEQLMQHLIKVKADIIISKEFKHVKADIDPLLFAVHPSGKVEQLIETHNLKPVKVKVMDVATGLTRKVKLADVENLERLIKLLRKLKRKGVFHA